MPYKYGAGWTPPEIPQYDKPEKVRDQRTPDDLKAQVSKQAEMRYAPALKELPRQHAQMQRQGQEAMAARGLAGTGIATREAMMPIAQQHQRQLADILQEKGLYKQTAYDELETRERDRTDRLMQEDFANWLSQKQMEGNLTQNDFSRWLSTQQHGLSVDQFNEAVRQFGQQFGLSREKFDWEKGITEDEIRRAEEAGGLTDPLSKFYDMGHTDKTAGAKQQGFAATKSIVDTVIGLHQEAGKSKFIPWSGVEAALNDPQNREIIALHHLSEDEAYLAAWERYLGVVGDMLRGVPNDELPDSFMREIRSGQRKADRIRKDLYGEDEKDGDTDRSLD